MAVDSNVRFLLNPFSSSTVPKVSWHDLFWPEEAFTWGSTLKLSSLANTKDMGIDQGLIINYESIYLRDKSTVTIHLQE